jgi:hypothetical protein
MDRRGSQPRRVARRWVAVGCLALTVSACDLRQLGHLELTKDNRLRFTAPKARSKAALPLTISWRMSDFRVTGADGLSTSGAGEFAVFLDRSPMAVGKDLKAVAKGDLACRHDPRCPSASYLAGKGVYVTTRTSLTLDLLPTVSGVGDEQHVATVVLLDGRGVRRTESAWHLEFRTPRRHLA